VGTEGVTVRGRLSRQRAVVTGAGRGLGRAIATSLAREGASVLLCDRTTSELERTGTAIERLGGDVALHRFDLTNRDELNEFISRAGRIDVLVNNAAVLPFTAVDSITVSEWQETLDVNLTAPFLLIRGLLPALREAPGGSIVNVSSRAGAAGFAQEVSYCASKFGLEGLTRALAVELEGEPVSVNTVTPGLRIKPTMMTDEEEARLSPSERTWTDAERLAPAFVYLAALRGRPSGKRFDALRLTEAIERDGFSLSPERVEELSE
jgi:NAD(P)-dependent dehydrogenase (short-subunit alcohol dehydrogenase family)